jgi:hypothetical protein
MTLRARFDETLSARVVEAHPLPGVRAGSALWRSGERLLAVQDDAWSAVWIDPHTRELQPLVFDGDGGPLPKREKPDFEAAVAMPDGSVCLLGSGSRRGRCRIIHWRPEGKPALDVFDGDAIYGAVQQQLQLAHRPNIEGGCVLGKKLRLFHRGAGGRPSATIDLPLRVLNGAAPQILAHCWYKLGEIAGITLGFTDASVIDETRVLYLAAAENSGDAIADGPVAGSAVGVIDANGARWTRLIEADGRPSLRKVEGLALDPGGLSGWLLTDPDDPEIPAELCRLQLSGPWRD